MKSFAALIVISGLVGCTADQQARFTAGYYGESGHTFSEAMSDVVRPLPDPARMAGSYCTGYANAYNSQPHGQAMVITPGVGTSFIYY